MDSSDIQTQDEQHVRAAFNDVRSGADFADAVIAQTCRVNGCAAVLSFDRDAQQRLRFQRP